MFIMESQTSETSFDFLLEARTRVASERGWFRYMVAEME